MNVMKISVSFFRFVVSLALLLAAGAVAARSEEYNIAIDDVMLDGDNLASFAAKGVVFDPQTNTLTLENATVQSVVSRNLDTDEAVPELTVVLKGENKVMRFFYLYGNDVITGDGALHVNPLNTPEEVAPVQDGLMFNKVLITGGCSISSISYMPLRASSITVDNASLNLWVRMEVDEMTLVNCRVLSPEGAVFDKGARTFVVDGRPFTGALVIGPAAETYGLTLAGTPVTSANAGGVTGMSVSGGVTYDAGTRTLSLDSAAINGDIVWSGEGVLTIVAKGFCKAVTLKSSGDVTVTGGGSLGLGSDRSEVLVMRGHTLTVKDETRLSGSSIYNPAYGFGTEPMHVVVDNAWLSLMLHSEDVQNVTYNLSQFHIYEPAGTAYEAETGRISMPGWADTRARLLVVPEWQGDVVPDEVIDIEDVNGTVDIMLKKKGYNPYADMKLKGYVDVDDLNAIVNIIVGKQD